MTRRTIRTAATCSALALATALAAAPAAAQVANGSFQGTPTTAFGSVTVTEGPGITNVVVGTPSAVLDWLPDDTATSTGTPINFQPAGTTATFANDPFATTDFAILNRIVPADATRPIVFDGTVISQLQTAAGGVSPGGTVFFYSPGGIIVGANAVFDVGNLGLTSAEPLVDASGNWYAGNQVQFQQAASGTSVNINPGAQITATAANSYVAAFAPQVTQNGTIDVNGQAALVAGEAGTITFSPDGLFDIQVSIGTDSTFAIDTNGSTGGPASTGGNNRVYMVAVPKNSAIQLAIGRGASIGFDIAGAADTVGNAVVLSAGYGVTGGQVDPLPSGGPGSARLSINDSNTLTTGTGIDFTSAVTGIASDAVDLQVYRQTNFASDATFQSVNTTQVIVTDIGGTPGALSVAGNLTLGTRRFGSFGSFADDAGVVQLFGFNGSSTTVGGNLTISASPLFDFNGDGTTTGGTAGLQLSDLSTLDVGGDLIVDASVSSQTSPTSTNALGGFAYGTLINGSSADIGGVFRLKSDGTAGSDAGGQGYNGQGGTSALTVNTGSNFSTSELAVSSDGFGGVDQGGGAGNGNGGSAIVNVADAGSQLTVLNGNSTGATTFDLTMLSASGYGGSTSGGGNGIGGTGVGGTALIVAGNGGTVALPQNTGFFGFHRIIARGQGGAALADGTTGGDGIGGDLAIVVDGGTLTSADILLSNFGLGGSANSSLTGVVNGGNGFGGDRSVTVINGGVMTASIPAGTGGGLGGGGSALGTGGDGTGGTASLTIDNATVNVVANTMGTQSDFIILDQTSGGSGAIGGNATGGSTFVSITNGGALNAAGRTIGISSSTFGGSSSADGASQGGSAVGGSTSLIVDNSTVTAGLLRVYADGTGGGLSGNVAPGGAVSGNGTGGVSGIGLTNASLSADTIEISAAGTGGSLDSAGNTNLTGGTGTGGTAYLEATGGGNTVTSQSIQIDASGNGAHIFAGTGAAGAGTGGTSWIHSFNGADFTVNGPSSVLADGIGGPADSGGTGGAAFAGQADVTAFGGGTLTLNDALTVSGSATGGDGTFGGTAASGPVGSNVVLNADNGTLTFNGPVLATADAQGGAGTSGNGGAANGGNVFITAQNGGTLAFGADANADAIATGGGSVDGNGGAATGGVVNYLAQSGGQINAGNSGADLSADSAATGGSASGNGSGGDAVSGFSAVQTNGGNIAIAGNVGIAADATGGSGVNGGNASGSTDQLAAVNAFLHSGGGGSITVGGTTALTSLLTGGDGANGGVGGNATGGAVVVLAQSNTASTTPSTMNLNDLFAVSSADGGNGGASATGTGGAGGNGSAGPVDVLGDAGNGQLTVNGTTNAISSGSGGAGGDGAVGGAGGNGTGGFVTVGTRSGPATSDNTGFGSYADIQEQAVGAGGNGGSGSAGAGGAGGSGTNGSAVILVRGSQVTISGTASLQAIGLGGNGGSGSTIDGVGGDGIVGGAGGVGVIASNRFNVPGDRGSLTANTINALATANGGTGSTNGASIVQDEPAIFSFLSADGDIGSLNMQALLGGSLTALPTAADEIALTDATVNVGDFNFLTVNNLVLALDGATLNTDNFTIQGNEIVLPATAPAAPGTVTATSSLQLFSSAVGGSIETYTNFVTDFGVSFTVDGDFQTGDFTANGDIFAQSNAGSVTMGDLTGNAITLIAAQNVTTGAIMATAGVSITAQNGSATTGPVSATSLAISSGQDLVVGDYSTSGDINLQSQSGSVTAGDLSGANIFLNGATGVTAGDLASAGLINVTSASNILLGMVTAGTNATLTTTGGSLTAGDIQTGGTLTIFSGGDQVLGNVDATSSVDIRGNAAITTGTIDGAASVYVISTGGAVTTQDITTGDPAATDLRRFGVALRGSSVTTGDLTTPGTIISASEAGSTAIGDISSGASVLLFSSADVATGAISASTAAGQYVYVGNTSDISRLGAGDDFSQIVAVDPARTGGSVSFGGPVTGNTVLVAAGGALTTGAVNAPARISFDAGGVVTLGGAVASDLVLVTTASSLSTAAVNGTSQVSFDAGGSVSLGGPVTSDTVSVAAGSSLSAGTVSGGSQVSLDAGGLASLNGAVSGPVVRVISGDIAIGSNGAISFGQSLQLLSRNFAGMFIGDGLPNSSPDSPTGGSGYRLSNTEFGKISGTGQVLIAGVNTQEQGSGGVDMTIGDLTIDGSRFDSTSSIVFGTGSVDTLEPSGRIRVDGQINATNMGPEKYLEFYADVFELNARTGGIFATDSQGGLGGIVLIEANNIHVATEEILQRLREDPFYAGRASDLNRAGDVDRPDGVLRALGLEFYPGQTLYIQNTGSLTDPAGFYTTIENSDIEPPGFENPQAEDVDVIINGKFATETGDVGGRDAFDLVVNNAESLAGFTDTSQINGCAFSTSVCTVSTGQETPPTNTAEIEVLTEDQSEEEPFDTDDDDDDDAEQDARAPITPPVVLINTSPLNPDVDVTDPVSGTGNPALIGASITDNAQGDQQ